MDKHVRLEQDVKMAISKIISEEMKNPNVTGIISITDVKITPDMKYAKVYVSIFGAKSKTKTFEALNDAKSKAFIRSSLAKMVKMRIVPELTFALDNSMEYGAHMDKVINDLKDSGQM
ncbi:MAG: 30S ribosome-binding factor RbfA [Clostridia bacterium]|nr:30S ribosome-binding factor RbfA [Clostridia bacterium]